MKENHTDQNYTLALTKLFQYKSENEEVQEIISRGYVGAKYRKGKALFIGINPSYLSSARPESYLYCVENAVKVYPKHYKHFGDLLIGTDYANDWTYLDLFQFRETDQKKLNLFYKNDIQFIIEQLQLSHKVICEINPEIIIVCNNSAANFFGINQKEKEDKNDNVWFGYDFEFKEKYGLDFITGRHSKSIIKSENQIALNTPILFTSTLTYKSKFDKQRLNWLLKRFINEKNETTT